MPNQNNPNDFIETQSIPYTARYWEQRYKQGGNSGTGSFGKLAEFKAEIVNSFINKYGIVSVIEYGCGDGNQLKLANYPKYIGFEVSPTAISLCQKIFQNDGTKSFKLMSKYNGNGFNGISKWIDENQFEICVCIKEFIEGDIVVYEEIKAVNVLYWWRWFRKYGKKL